MKKNIISNTPSKGGDDFSALIGDKLLCEILIRLPVETESIMRCKLVCKRWQSIIEQDDYFHNLHLTQSKTKPALIISSVLKNQETLIDIFPSENLFKGGAAVHLSTITRCEPMLASVNGLFCWVERNKNNVGVRVFNPTTREKTPLIETIMNTGEEGKEQGVWVYRKPWFAFGCDVQAKEHKVICMWEIQKLSGMYQPLRVVERVCEVMTVGDNTWRRIDAVPPYNVQGDPLNVNGVIYRLNAGSLDWEAPDCNALIAFDVETETFSVIKIPYNVLDEPIILWNPPTVELLEVDGCLAILDARKSDGTVKLWIMVTTSNWIEETISMPFNWSLLDRLTFQPIPGTDQIIIKPDHREVINYVNLFYYDRKKKTSTKVTFTGIHSLLSPYSIDIFTESLLPVQKKHQHQQQQQQQHTQSPQKKLKLLS